MKTVSLKLSEALDARLSALAREQKRTKSDLVREALEDYLSNGAKTQVASPYARIRHLVGIAKDGPRDLATNKRHMKGFGE